MGNISKIDYFLLTVFVIVSLMVANDFYKINMQAEAARQITYIIGVTILVSAILAYVKSKSRKLYFFLIVIISIAIIKIQLSPISILMPALVMTLITIFSLRHSKNYLMNYALIYGLIAFIANIPNLSNNINLIYFDRALTILIITYTIYLINKNFIYINNLFNYNLNDVNVFSNTIITATILILIFETSVVSFLFDDINGYLWIPLASVIKSYSLVGRDLPASMYFHSLHGLSFLSLFLSMEVLPNWKSAASSFKWWNFLSFTVVTLIFSYEIKNKLNINDNLKSLIYIIFLSSPFIAFQILNNQTDFVVYLTIIIIILKLIKSDYLISKIDITTTDYLIFGLLINVSPKIITILLPVLAISFFSNISNIIKEKNRVVKLLLNYILLLIPSTPIFIRNYLSTSNPVFPSQNKLWKSEYFDQVGIVANKFYANWPYDISLYFNFISNTPKSIEPFYVSTPKFYGFISILLITFLAITLPLIVKRIGSKKNNILTLLYLSFLIFFVSLHLTGGQLKYFWASQLILVMVFFNLVTILLEKFNLNIQKSIVVFLFIVMVPLSLNSPFTHSPYSLINNFIYGSDSSNWIGKLKFYEKVNKVITGDQYILMSYLQDKLFLNNTNIYEIDWYNHSIQRKYNETVSKYLIKKNHKFLDIFLCENNIGYLISNDGGFGQIKDYLSSLEVILSESGLILYKFECKVLN